MPDFNLLLTADAHTFKLSEHPSNRGTKSVRNSDEFATELQYSPPNPPTGAIALGGNRYSGNSVEGEKPMPKVKPSAAIANYAVSQAVECQKRARQREAQARRHEAASQFEDACKCRSDAELERQRAHEYTMAAEMVREAASIREARKTENAVKTLYLANPYGFSKMQKRTLLPELQQALESLGAEVWEPFARNNQIAMIEPGWAYKVGQADMRDVWSSDGIFAVVNGCPPDEGVMVELGMAIAWGKPTFLFRDDFRRCTDSENYPLNLMLYTGLPEEKWRDYWYESIEELSDPDKALASWLAKK